MISIIIPVRYRIDLTRVCIDSILNYTRDYELILVQEGVDEDIFELLNEYANLHSNVHYVQNKVPRGYAGALNEGMKIATGEYFCFMNNDTVATPHWMENLLKAFSDKEVGLATPTFWGTGERQSVDWNQGGQVYDYVIDPTFLSAVCYVMPRRVIEEIGIWDEQFFHGCEDVDMNIRLFKSPYTAVVVRSSFIYHYGGASTRELVGNNAARAREHYKGKIEMLEKKHGIDMKSRFNM